MQVPNVVLEVHTLMQTGWLANFCFRWLLPPFSSLLPVFSLASLGTTDASNESVPASKLKEIMDSSHVLFRCLQKRERSYYFFSC